MNRLIDNYFASKPNLSSKSKETYTNNVRRLYEVLGITPSTDITRVSQKKVINTIKQSNYDPIALTRMYLGLYYAKKQTTPTLIKKFLNNIQEQKINQQPIVNEKLIEDLDYNSLLDMLSQLQDTTYMMFYILIHFNVRNQDLVVQLHKPSKDEKGNFLYKSAGKIHYIRRDYKTFSKYGEKHHIIDDPRFIQYFNKFSTSNYIFGNNESSVRKRITRTASKFGFSGVNQQIIYKVIQRHYEQQNDYKKLAEIAQHRGHELETQKSYYSSMK